MFFNCFPLLINFLYTFYPEHSSRISYLTIIKTTNEEIFFYQNKLFFLLSKILADSTRIHIVNPKITAPKLNSNRLGSSVLSPDHLSTTCSTIAHTVMASRKTIGTTV